jgi:serine/threonine-protein kinase
MRCGQCGEQLQSGAHFCGQCGAPADAPVPSVVGQTIAGRYRLLRQVGEGGMGTVYEAEQTLGSSVRAVAVKLLRPEWSHDPSVKARFHREAATVARLEHFNTVRIYDFGATDTGTLYIVMEFLHGRSLQSVLDEQGALPAERVLHLVRQAAASLDEAHRLGIVHRDLKPDNFLLLDSYASQRDVVKLVDFGIAKGEATPGSSTTKLTEFGAFVGTPGYMSPEQFIGGGASPQSDVYSLGTTTYQMLAGRLPFEAETVMQWAQAHLNTTPPPLEPHNAAGPIPEAMRAAVSRALSKSPAHRQASAIEFARELAGEVIDAAVRSTAKAPSAAPLAARIDEPMRPEFPPRPPSEAPRPSRAPRLNQSPWPGELARVAEPAPAPAASATPPPPSPAVEPPPAPAQKPLGGPAPTAAIVASSPMKTAPMAQMPDIQAAASNPWGTPTTQPMPQAGTPSYAPARFSQPPPLAAPRRGGTGRLILLAIVIPFAGVAAVAGFFALRGYRVFPWQTSAGPDVAPPPLFTTEPGSANTAPPSEQSPEPSEPERPSARPTPPRPSAPSSPKPSPPKPSPPPASGTPAPAPTSPVPLPPGSLPGLPVPGSAGAPGQPQPAPSNPIPPGLPWNLPTSGACERCLSALQGNGNYTVVTAIGEHLLCEDRAARERCEAQIVEQAPLVAERAARAGDCPAALATVAAAINVRISQDRFREVNSLCGLR